MNKLCVVGFNNAHHGSSTATLSVSSADANPHGLPAFPWPKAEFPQLKYPLSNFEHENRAEEDRCLDGFRAIIKAQRAEGGDVAALMVEPMSTFGNQMATPYFFKQLRKITRDEGINMIVDETNTGMGASGKNWAHEYWYLQDSPDFMIFGGKSGCGGFYSNIAHRLNDLDTSYTQVIDMVRVLRYGQMWNIIEKQNLLHLQKDTSSFLKIELNRVADQTGLISNIRGYGTHLGFDCEHPLQVQRWFQRTGINMHLCGPKTFALRPSLVLGVSDAAQLRESIRHYNPNFEV